MVGQCKLVHEGKFKDACHTSMGVEAITDNFVNANSPNGTSKRGGWIKPSMCFVKLNVHAYFDHDQHRGTTGVVFRDDKGNFIIGEN